MSQVAKMYLRGSLCNKVLKGLNPEQRTEIEKIIEQVIEDPNLQQCRREFRNALARTIKNEYCDIDVGEQDYRIAVMRAAVAAKFGKNPAEKALDDPIQRKKWFQTWVFNYLRQIFRENKYPQVNQAKRDILPADLAAIQEVELAICNSIEYEKDPNHRRLLRTIFNQRQVIDKDNGFNVVFDYWSFPVQLTDNLKKLEEAYFTDNIKIAQTPMGVEIKRLAGKMPARQVIKWQQQVIKEASFDDGQEEDGENYRNRLEMEVMNKANTCSDTVDEEDILAKLHKSIPTEAVSVLDIYMEESRPQDFIDKYGPSKPKSADVAEYLNKTPKEVRNLLRVIKWHCMALGIGR